MLTWCAKAFTTALVLISALGWTPQLHKQKRVYSRKNIFSKSKHIHCSSSCCRSSCIRRCSSTGSNANKVNSDTPTTTKKSKKPKQVRIDALLVSRGVVDNAKAAAALVLAGNVFVRGDHKITSPAQKVADEEPLRVRSKRNHPWVSRGGLKLSHAIEVWPLLAQAVAREGSIGIDVGSSTGGFTDVLLTNGCSRVYSVDVGKGIIDWRLRTDPRVVMLEGFNARELTTHALEKAHALQANECQSSNTDASRSAEPSTEAEAAVAPSVLEAPNVLVCDASFIPLATVLPAAMDLCAPRTVLCALVKPQFEARRDQVGEGGVVRDPQVHEEVCAKATAWLDNMPGWRFEAMDTSPVVGPMGNVEFLMLGTKTGITTEAS